VDNCALTKRMRRDIAPAWTHRLFLWFPRFGNWFANAWAWRVRRCG
jgi:hypothetical protein